MPIIDTPAGTLEVQNAILSASEFRATQKIGVANSAPTKTFSVGDKLHVSTTDLDTVSISGNLVAQKVKVGNLLVSPTFDLASVSNVGNTTSNIIQFANATTGFTTTANVEIGGNITLTSNAQVKVGSNVLAEYTGPHPREPKELPLKKYPEILFEEGKFDRNDTTNTYTQGGYTVTTTTDENPDTPAYHAFDNKMFADGDDLNRWQTLNHGYYGSIADTTTGPVTTLANGTTTRGSYIQLESPHKIVVSRYAIWSQENAILFRPKKVILLGSNTGGTDWVSIDPAGEVEPEFVSTGIGSKISIKAIVSFTNTTAYKYHRLVVRATNGATVVLVQELELYGRDESSETVGDLSLDTTLKSTFNSVRSNNYVMYFDGEDPQGSPVVPKYLPSGAAKTITPNNITFDATNNCWSLNGSTESNVTTADLGFEGDAPHTVSMWVNSSNLDANATTQQLFSIGSGYDKSFLRVDDTQIAANTWHNVTYAYQGEDGSKVTYVDGRKVEEAQVEDTFGNYPPFAMDNYEVGGYRVSASSRYTANSFWYPYEAFNGSVGGTIGHLTNDNHYTTSDPGTYNGTDTNAFLGTRVDTGADIVEGDWLKIEMPHKLVANYLQIYSSSDEPDSFKLYGSNDDSVWTELLSVTGNTTINAYLDYPTTTRGAFKYFALVVSKQGSTQTYWRLDEMKIYGHKEGDLTRFPEPTRVLKYPHVNFTGHGTAPTTGYHATARRGYVVSASTKYGSATLTDAWRAFDGVVDLTSGSGGQSWDSGQNTYASSGTGRASTGTTTFNTRDGEWINVKFPNKVLLTSYQHWTRMDRDHEGPYSGYLYGSNDGFSTFQEIHRFSAITLPTISGGVKYLHTVSSSYTPDGGSAVALIPYNEYRLQVTHTQGSPYLNIALLEFYGTQEDTGTPAIVGGPFAGKVANFRVYDKYLGEERIQEIYDAQKDEFGHKKSSMTFYKGRIGVGTTEPEGALTVLDEPHALEKFPARAVSTNDAYVEGQGRFHFSSSWRGGTNQSDSIAYQPFGNSSSSATFQPIRNELLSDDVDYGSWMKIESPQAMSLKKAEIGLDQEWYQIGSTFGGGANNHMMGRCVALNKNGTRVAISRTFYTDTLSNQGLVQVFDWNGTSWVQVGNGILGDTAQDRLGENELDLDDEGNTLIVGSKQDGIGSVGGQVDVYYLNGTTWTLKGSSFNLSGGATEYGSGVAISADGNTIALSEKNANSNAGKVQVFTWSGSAWVQKGSDMVGAAGDEIGSRVNMTPDGNYIITSNENVDSNNGKVWVYKWNGSAWVLRYSQTGTGNDYFGYDVSISDDANVIAIGEFINDDYATDHGAVYIRRWNGTTYAAEQTLFAQYASEDAAYDYFGSSCKLSGDGTRLVAGSRYVPGTGNDSKGRVFTFEYDGANWIRRGGESDALDYGTEGNQGTTGTGSEVGFLNSLSISRDGSVIGVGMYRDDSFHSDGGAAKIFQMASNVKGIWGSNDDKNWTKITGNSIAVRGKIKGAEQADFTNLDNSNYYKYHAIVYDNFSRVDYANLYGIREKGSSTLHDGALTLTKNLDVPRIGPAFDADDTPRRDRLVVEYNTSTNPTFYGGVRDTSGRGNDGVFYGEASYNATEKAIDIAGVPNGSSAPTTSAYLDVGQRLPFKGNQAHTISFWYNKRISSQTQSLISLWKEGTDYNSTGHHSGILQEADGKLNFWHWGADQKFTDPLGDGSTGWRHVAAVYTGGTVADQKLYINGIGATFHSYASGSGTVTIDITNAKMTMGQDIYRGNYYFQSDTEFSGIKIYDTILTAQEVKTLYDMGRCDEGHHVVNFSKTRVGIGLGDGEVPGAALDVRGRIMREYNPGEIIEELNVVCNGRPVTVLSGTYTPTNVTAAQTSSATHTEVTGSNITYNKPAGAKRIYYKFACQWEDNNNGALTNFKIQIYHNGAWRDINPSRYLHSAAYTNDGNNHGSAWVINEHIFECNAGTESQNDGYFLSSKTSYTFRVTWRQHGSGTGYQSILHRNDWWDGSANDVFRPPQLTIRAIA